MTKLTVTTDEPGVEELTSFKGKATKVENKLANLTIDTPEAAQEAAEMLIYVKENGLEVASRHSEIADPIKVGLKKLDGFFKPVKDRYVAAEAALKKALLEYRSALRETHEQLETELMAKVDKGEMTLDDAINEMESEIAGLEKTIKTPRGKVTISAIKDVVIEDPDKIPDEFRGIDTAAVRKAALGNKAQGIPAQPVPGARVTWKESVKV